MDGFQVVGILKYTNIKDNQINFHRNSLLIAIIFGNNNIIMYSHALYHAHTQKMNDYWFRAS